MFGLNTVPMICQFFGQFVHVLLCFLFVSHMGLEIQGIGYAGTISNFSVYLSMLIYSFFIEEIRPAIQLPNKKAFRGIFEYLKLGLPTAMMICLEWWAFELMTLMSGYISVKAQASQVLLINLSAVMYMTSQGLNTSAAANIGQQIGKQNVQKAKDYYKVTIWVSFFTISLVVVSIYVFAEEVFSGFTNN